MAKQSTESRRQGIDPLCIGIVKRSSAPAMYPHSIGSTQHSADQLRLYIALSREGDAANCVGMELKINALF